MEKHSDKQPFVITAISLKPLVLVFESTPLLSLSQESEIIAYVHTVQGISPVCIIHLLH